MQNMDANIEQLFHMGHDITSDVMGQLLLNPLHKMVDLVLAHL
ncbi:MAG TPA: hypothetical protein VLE95_08995 [Chlamydiales bacterium]|nr:hypothetical protein [Chlamydiales bacterium]